MWESREDIPETLSIYDVKGFAETVRLLDEHYPRIKACLTIGPIGGYEQVEFTCYDHLGRMYEQSYIVSEGAFYSERTLEPLTVLNSIKQSVPIFQGRFYYAG